MNGVLNDQYSHMLANSIDHYQSIQHQEQLNLIIAQQEYLLVKTYGLVPFRDGDQWCVLLGEDIQTGIVGFGDSPNDAVLAFYKAFHTPISKEATHE